MRTTCLDGSAGVLQEGEEGRELEPAEGLYCGRGAEGEAVQDAQNRFQDCRVCPLQQRQ
jgi:hypothetical protein